MTKPHARRSAAARGIGLDQSAGVPVRRLAAGRLRHRGSRSLMVGLPVRLWPVRACAPGWRIRTAR